MDRTSTGTESRAVISSRSFSRRPFTSAGAAFVSCSGEAGGGSSKSTV